VTLKMVSVIVPVRNGERTISDCIGSLLRQDFPKNKYEVIVIDNNSSDGTAESIRRHPVRYLLEKRKGPAAARNAGIAASQGNLMAFTDSDCVAKEDWLSEGIRAFESDEVGCVSGRVCAGRAGNIYERIIADKKEYDTPADYHGLPPYAITANALFRREVFDAIGDFDTSLRAAEDKDLCWRMLKKTGLVIKRCPAAIVYHKHRSDLKSYFRQYFSYGIYNVRLQKKHPDAFRGFKREKILTELISVVSQGICVPKVFWMTIEDVDKDYTRALHLMNLARQSAYLSGRMLGKLKDFKS